MEHYSNAQQRCIAMVERLNQELDWNLTAAEQQAYITNLLLYLPKRCSNHLLQRIVCNYHADHAQVQALCYDVHTQNDQAWREWMRRAMQLLRKANLAWSSDAAIDDDDLAQVAYIALMRSLQQFRYRSPFVAWASRVIVFSVRRYIRDTYADKRRLRPVSLEKLGEFEPCDPTLETPETLATARIMFAQISAILNQHPDQRLRKIFYLWAMHDQSAAQIGHLVDLSGSRVRGLMCLARDYLHEHADIQHWCGDEAEG